MHILRTHINKFLIIIINPCVRKDASTLRINGSVPFSNCVVAIVLIRKSWSRIKKCQTTALRTGTLPHQRTKGLPSVVLVEDVRLHVFMDLTRFKLCVKMVEFASSVKGIVS